MDPLLLKNYERELQFIREMGMEYAKEFPKIASRLGIDSVETTDPYVERLYEGFAFLTARVQMRIDAEYPKFTQNLLNIVYPQYLTPTPSMCVVQFNPSTKASLEAGVKVVRDTDLRSNLKKGEQTACEYRTTQDVTLWPVKIKEAEYFSNIGSVADITLPRGAKPKAGLRLRVASTVDDQPLSECMLDRLVLHLSGHSGQSMRIYEQLFGNACAVVVRSIERPSTWTEVLPENSLVQVGFSNDQALLPEDNRTFSGYRLLREYFSFSERFMFAEIKNLGRSIEQCQQMEMDIIVLFDRYDPELENRITADDFALNCSPAINLFPKRVDRIHLTNQPDHHVVPDRTRPMDFEVFQVEKVVGHGSNADEQQTFLPFYASTDMTDFPEHAAFYSIRRDRRVLSTKQRRRGPRSSYIGSESFLSLVDANEAPYSNTLKQLEIHTLCTNRDLPLQMATGKGNTDFTLDISAPVESIRCLKGPTRPRPSLTHAQGKSAWRLVNQLSLNYLSLVDSEKGKGAAALRDLLTLYADANDASIKKQIEGVRSITSEQVTRRIPLPGPIAFGRGLQISVTFDESAFVGSGVFLLGSILERFFARYVSINSFTETVILSVDRGEIMKWPVRIGQRNII